MKTISSQTLFFIYKKIRKEAVNTRVKLSTTSQLFSLKISGKIKAKMSLADDKRNNSTMEYGGDESPNRSIGTVTRQRPSPLLQIPPPATDSSLSTTTAPADMDTVSYVAGERAAYARAFAAALPSQQALGQLFQAVDTLHERGEADAAAVRVLQEERVSTATAVAMISRRIDSMESRPALSPDVVAALQHLRETLSDISSTQQRSLEAVVGYAGHSGFLVQQLTTLLHTATGFAASTLSKADVLAVFLSRKILVGNVVEPAVGASSSNALLTKRKLRTALGAVLFVGCVEGVWQLHQRMSSSLPRSLRPVTAPFKSGMKVVRVAVWSAAFVLTANETRNACIGLAARLGSSNSNSCNTSNTSSTEVVILERENDDDEHDAPPPPYSPSLAGRLADIESGRTTPSPSRSTPSIKNNSPLPQQQQQQQELLRDTVVFEQNKRTSQPEP